VPRGQHRVSPYSLQNTTCSARDHAATASNSEGGGCLSLDVSSTKHKTDSVTGSHRHARKVITSGVKQEGALKASKAGHELRAVYKSTMGWMSSALRSLMGGSSRLSPRLCRRSPRLSLILHCRPSTAGVLLESCPKFWNCSKVCDRIVVWYKYTF
jgi:hypothetical protein